VVDSLLQSTNAGVHVKNKRELKEILLRWYREFKQYGEPIYTPVQKNVMEYTQVNMAKKFAEVLNANVKHFKL